MGASGGGCNTSILSSASSSSPYVTPTRTKLTERDPVKPPPCTVSVRVLWLFETSLASFSSLDMFPFFLFLFFVRAERRPCDPSHPPFLSGNGKADRGKRGRKRRRSSSAGATAASITYPTLMHDWKASASSEDCIIYTEPPSKKNKKTFKKWRGDPPLQLMLTKRWLNTEKYREKMGGN